MIPRSFGSKASVIPSVIAVVMLIQRIWTGRIGRVIPRRMASREHQSLPPVGRERPDDELLQVVEDPSPFFDRGLDRGEVVVREDHVGRLARGLRPTEGHGHTDVRAAESRRVVDPIAGHRHNLTASLQGFNQAKLVLGTDTGEDRRSARGSEQILV